MRINLTSVLVDDQEKALASTPTCSGSRRRPTSRLGEHRWLTVVSPGGSRRHGALLEPDDHPAAAVQGRAGRRTGSRSPRSPSTTSSAEYERLSALGVRFTQEPTEMGPVTTAVFDDTCGNLIQIAAVTT